jgi:hypothetical protein
MDPPASDPEVAPEAPAEAPVATGSPVGAPPVPRPSALRGAAVTLEALLRRLLATEKPADPPSAPPPEDSATSRRTLLLFGGAVLVGAVTTATVRGIMITRRPAFVESEPSAAPVVSASGKSPHHPLPAPRASASAP